VASQHLNRCFHVKTIAKALAAPKKLFMVFSEGGCFHVKTVLSLYIANNLVAANMPRYSTMSRSLLCHIRQRLCPRRHKPARTTDGSPPDPTARTNASENNEQANLPPQQPSNALWGDSAALFEIRSGSRPPAKSEGRSAPLALRAPGPPQPNIPLLTKPQPAQIAQERTKNQPNKRKSNSSTIYVYFISVFP
jgi:hypothetical protein